MFASNGGRREVLNCMQQISVLTPEQSQMWSLNCFCDNADGTGCPVDLLPPAKIPSERELHPQFPEGAQWHGGSEPSNLWALHIGGGG